MMIVECRSARPHHNNSNHPLAYDHDPGDESSTRLVVDHRRLTLHYITCTTRAISSARLRLRPRDEMTSYISRCPPSSRVGVFSVACARSIRSLAERWTDSSSPHTQLCVAIRQRRGLGRVSLFTTHTRHHPAREDGSCEPTSRRRLVGESSLRGV